MAKEIANSIYMLSSCGTRPTYEHPSIESYARALSAGESLRESYLRILNETLGSASLMSDVMRSVAHDLSKRFAADVVEKTTIESKTEIVANPEPVTSLELRYKTLVSKFDISTTRPRTIIVGRLPICDMQLPTAEYNSDGITISRIPLILITLPVVQLLVVVDVGSILGFKVIHRGDSSLPLEASTPSERRCLIFPLSERGIVIDLLPSSHKEMTAELLPTNTSVVGRGPGPSPTTSLNATIDPAAMPATASIVVPVIVPDPPPVVQTIIVAKQPTPTHVLVISPPTCIICMERSRAITYDCGHFVACEQCTNELDKCPTCRAPFPDEVAKKQQRRYKQEAQWMSNVAPAR